MAASSSGEELLGSAPDCTIFALAVGYATARRTASLSCCTISAGVLAETNNLRVTVKLATVKKQQATTHHQFAVHSLGFVTQKTMTNLSEVLS
ncbi:hypothetical protein [Verminephrobacter eiseniae]|uniref:hypothetical protein n=1 Tax=Verminephrobacter eiseniae TaxID=364317 RepID=UPI00223913E3|nr:hypothetical protein [Verminephrobacter eiseniae]